MATSEELDDPFLRHFQRDPLPDAGIRIILLTDLPDARAGAILAAIADPLRSTGRPVETRAEPVRSDGLGRALARGLDGAHLPLVLVTTAEEPCLEAHWRPMLEAIDH